MNHYYFICYKLLAFLFRAYCVYALRFYLEKTSGKQNTHFQQQQLNVWAKRNASRSELSMCARNMHRRIHVGIFKSSQLELSRNRERKRDEERATEKACDSIEYCMCVFDVHMRYETRLAYRFFQHRPSSLTHCRPIERVSVRLLFSVAVVVSQFTLDLSDSTAYLCLCCSVSLSLFWPHRGAFAFYNLNLNL